MYTLYTAYNKWFDSIVSCSFVLINIRVDIKLLSCFILLGYFCRNYNCIHQQFNFTCRYLSKFANTMCSTLKSIFAPAGEVCGMIFRYLADKAGETEGSFHNHVANLMTGLHQARPDCFITCVHRMQKHYPPVANRYLNIDAKILTCTP